MTNPIRDFLKTLPKPLLQVCSLALIAGIAFADYVTGYDLSLGLFCVAPVSLLSWYVSIRAGMLAAVFSAVLWYFVTASFAPPGLAPIILVWNSAIRCGFFAIISGLTASLRPAYERQHLLARTNPLTGALHSRAFLEAARLELARAVRNRYPVTVVYLDLDNFKSLNDSNGHTAGDSLLKDIGNVLRTG